jgi:CubicO group peptidase (beta-lactamase class C family)
MKTSSKNLGTDTSVHAAQNARLGTRVSVPLTSRRGFLASSLPALGLAQSGPCAEDKTIDEVTRSLDAEFQKGMAQWKVPSVSYAILACGRVRAARALGETRVGGGKEPTVHTLYQAASISKTVAAVTALRLVQAGKLELDKDVAPRLKSWHLPPGPQNAEDPVTLRRLLGMTAGVNIHGFPGYDASAQQPSLVQILDGTKPIANSDAIRVVKRPGAQQEYSGGGYQIAELLMQDVAGQPYTALVSKLVLEPLEMRDSSLEHPLKGAFAERAADGHNAAGEPLPGRWHNYPELAAAGFWTTPSDLGRMALALSESWRKGGFLRQEIAHQMMMHVDGFGYGIGGAVTGTGDEMAFAKGGDNAGYHCDLVFFPATGQGMAIMTNGDRGPRLFDPAMRAAATGLHWPAFRAFGG